MEKIKSKFVLVSEHNGCGKIVLFDKEPDFQPLYKTLYEDVEIQFNENTTITLNGMKHNYELTLHDTYLKDIDDDVHPHYIKKTRFRKNEYVKRGWYRLLHNTLATIIYKNYIIIDERLR